MANSIDLIYSKNVIKDLEKVYSELSKTHELIDKLSKKNIDFFGSDSPKNLAQMQKLMTDFQKMEKANASLTRQYNQQEKTIQSLQNQLTKLTQKQTENTTSKKKEVQAILDQSKSYQGLAKQKEKALAQYEKELAKTAAAENLYNKVQAKLNALSNEYKNLAIRKELENNLTEEETKRYNELQGKILTYDKALKAVDATMGRHQRNVGNYAGSFNPLSNSINQLTREMPAFTNSLQTGFMAISNNLPIFSDAISQAIQQNRELQAQGEPTESVLKQVANALFSFQTLMGVGITLLTVYGAEIISFISNLGDLEQSLGEVEKAQDSYNNAKTKGIADSQNEMIALRQLMNIAKDEKKTMDERNLAIKLMRDQYPYFLKQISDQELLSGKATRAENDLTNAINANSQAQNKQQSLNNTRERIAQIDAEIEARKKYQIELKKLSNSINISDKENQLSNFKNAQQKAEFIKMTQDEISALKLSEKERRKRRDDLDDEVLSTGNLNVLSAEKNRLEKETMFLQKFVNKNTEDAILLRWKEDKADKSKIKNLKDLEIEQADYLAREYEFRRLSLDNLIKNNDEVVKDESKSLEERIDAYNRFIDFKKKRVQLDYDYENATIEKELKDQTDEINKAYKEQLNTISEALKEGTTTQVTAKEKRNQALIEKDNALKSLEKKILFDRHINTENFVQSQKELSDEYRKEVINKLLIEFEKLDKQNEIAQSKLNSLTNRAFTGGTLNMKSPLSAFKTYFEDREKIEEEASVKSIELDLNETKLKIANSFMVNGIETEEHKKLIAKKIELEIQLQNVKDKNQEKELKRIEELKKTLNDYYSSFGEDLANKGGFGKLLGLFNGDLKKFEGDATATALAVSEAFQEAFNTISEMSNAYFQKEFDNLERQRNLSIKFAGESTSAKESIEKQYDERRKQLERRQAEQRKRLAIFNAVVDTAQGVVGAIARADLYPYNFVLAGIIGALGAAQIAMISSQQVPAYAEGTDNHGGGLMLINDGKGNNYTETVETPDGKLKQYKGRNVLVNAPKGTKVHTHEQWQEKLNNLLVSAGINHSKMSFDLPIINNNGISETEFNAGISKLANVIQSKESITLVRDEKGERIYKKLQGQRQQMLNARLNIKGYDI